MELLAVEDEQKMRVLHLQPYLRLSCGVTRVIRQLMTSNINDCRQFAGCIGGDAAPEFVKAQLPILRLGGVKSFFFLPWHIILLLRYAKKNRITLLHSHHRYFDFAGYFLAKLLKIPTITSVHSKVYSAKAFSYKASAFIAPGEAIKQHLMRNFRIRGEKITVINNFIVPADYEYDDAAVQKFRSLYRIPTDRTVLLFIGRFSKEKGIDILLSAMRRIMHDFSDLFIILAGNGEERRFVKRYCEQHLVSYAIIEATPNAGALYALADVVVLPSRVDPFPLVMLEAGFLKKPLLASSVDGIAEVITHKATGFLIEPGSRDSLRKGLDELLSDSQLRTTITEGLHRLVAEKFMNDAAILKYHKFYSTVHQSYGR